MARTIKCPLEIGKRYSWAVRGTEWGVYTIKEVEHIDGYYYVSADIEYERPDLEISFIYSWGVNAALNKETGKEVRYWRKDILAQKVKKGHFKPC